MTQLGLRVRLKLSKAQESLNLQGSETHSFLLVMVQGNGNLELCWQLSHHQREFCVRVQITGMQRLSGKQEKVRMLLFEPLNPAGPEAGYYF